MLKTAELFSLNKSLAGEYLEKTEYPWQAVSGIRELILSLSVRLNKCEYNQIKGNVWVHKDAVIAPSAYIGSPCIIGAGTEIRHGAFIRSSALIGEYCVIGNSTEIKNSILFDGVQVPHFNYVGDSILGYRAHLGAGAIISNVKSDRSCIVLYDGITRVATGLKKLGAMLGDYAEIGCNSVLCPGSVIGSNTTVYPLSLVRGEVPENRIYKSADCIAVKEKFNG